MRATTMLVFLLLIIVSVSCKKSKKADKAKTHNKIVKIKTNEPNPGYVNDRIRPNRNESKPLYPDALLAKEQPFSPAWMDYCDPYHCNDYHRPACGLNRRRMKFQWFQSGCHIVLNNKCATYRGFLKFDQVDPAYCRAYVMFALRGGCPPRCPSDPAPVCAARVADGKLFVFRNRCQLYAVNCRGKLQDYVEVSSDVCLSDVDLVTRALEYLTVRELNETNDDHDDHDDDDDRYYIE